MKIVIVLSVLGFYFILAFAIARLCAVNAGWERAADLSPPDGERDFAEPNIKDPEGQDDPPKGRADDEGKEVDRERLLP